MSSRQSRQHPDITRQTATVIPPNVLVHVLHLADLRGLNTRAWFAGLGLTREQLLDPHMKLSYRQARSVLLRALEDFDEPGLGLVVGSGETMGAFGLLGLLMMTASSFGEAMRLGIENHEVSGSLLDMGFESVEPGRVALVLWPRFDDPQLQPFLCEEIIASALMVAREMVGPQFTLQRVELTYRAPEYAWMYTHILGCPVQFSAATNRAVIDAHWLQTPLAGHNPLAARQALELCRAQLRNAQASASQEIVVAVERQLRAQLERQPRIGDIAEALHLSERSLRRRLAEAGRAFREIHDQVRTERALELLRGSALSIMEVAGAVGFSDAREFRRAFKRWTGMAPRALRTLHTSTHVGRDAPPR